MSTPPKPPLGTTQSHVPAPSDRDAPSIPADGGTLPQAGPSRAALAGAPLQVPGYEIQGELGRGGMGVVYLARNILMNRQEVLKVADRGLLEKQPGAAERFLREIRAAARLGHENVVKAYSALQVGDLLVFAMEYIDGEDLSKLVQRQGPLAVTYACHYVSQAAMGLQHAHEQGMVHRDIKPHNLILSRRGKKHVVKILDFGLAKAVREGEAVMDLTGLGAMMGTPAYIAPEQALDAARADIRADIYSLGCTLYFLLTGAPPFTGPSHFAVLQAHLSATAAPLRQLRADAPAELEAVVAKMMAKEPGARFQKPSDVAKALAPIIKPATAAKTEPLPVAAPYREPEVQAIIPPLPRPALPAPLPRSNSRSAPKGGEETSPLRTNRGRGGVSPPFSNRPSAPWLALLGVPALILLLVAACAGGAYLLTLSPAPSTAPVAAPPWLTKTPPAKDKPAPPGEPARAIAPFDAREAKRLQQAWADYLGLSVVREVDLGGDVVLKLVLIPPGSFPMGSPDSDKLADTDEKPQHQVTLTKPFYLGMYPVTQGEYVRVTGLKNPSGFTMGGKYEKDVQGLDTAKFPVEEVSWEEAAAFCEALNGKDTKRPAGWKYALPTEAEWEYACRAGTTTAYFFGDDPKQLGDYAWYFDNSGQRTHAVGTKPQPNPWGLYDMHGNVWQWCIDLYDGYGKSDITDPQNLSTGSARVFRGGSWYNYAEDCRSAYRNRNAPGDRNTDLGLRVCFRLD